MNKAGISGCLAGLLLAGLAVLMFSTHTNALAQGPPGGGPAGGQVTTQAITPTVAGTDFSMNPTLYVVGTAHLDTQWRWTIQETIDAYLKDTLDQNFALFEAYPNYVFSFEGAFRYMLIQEYYPEQYARLKTYIAQGRWAVAGGSIDAGDVNVVSPEALLRQFLLGNNYFEDEFDRRSADVYLPDCFGFGWALPSVAAHAGLKGFSTQKLSWGSAAGIPFDIGVWQGPDGASVIAALNPGAYVSEIDHDLSHDAEWLRRINALGDRYGLYAGYRYFGVGDTGGAPDPSSVAWLERSITGDGPLQVLSAPSDRLYNEITSAQRARLPVYSSELLMTTHGTGSYTAQAAMKRWHRQNELLADAAERASVVAHWLGAISYPRQRLNEAWVRFLWHTFHDDLTGTSIPEAYLFSANDEALSRNQFTAALANAVGGTVRALDTQTVGQPVVVYNPLAMDRQDVVEATVRFPGGAPPAVCVYGPDGNQVPSQVQGVLGDAEPAPPEQAPPVRILFLADVPAVGFAVFDVRPAVGACAPETSSTGLTVTPSTLENDRYRVALDGNGDVASVWDKAAGRELLSSALHLQLLPDWSPRWPAWEIQYGDVQAAPRALVDGPAEVTVLEAGPVRGTLQVVRYKDGSGFVQRISLAGGGNRVEVDAWIDWRTPQTLLKAAFPLAVSNPEATYDLGLGTIRRPNNRPQLYEVPAQQWADITAADGSLGVSVLNDCKYGWDKPDDHTLRLTLLHTPGVYADSWLADQATLDIGEHRLRYAIVGHQGDWRAGDTPGEAARFNQPLLAFQATRHAGALGRRYAFVSVSDRQVAVRAIKQAERSAEIVIRLQETRGEVVPQVVVSLGAGLSSAREVNGAEQPLGPATVQDGRLVTSLAPYQPRTFAVTLAPPPIALTRPETRPVSLPFNLDAISSDHKRADGDLGGYTLPAEGMPEAIVSGDIPFQIGPQTDGASNTLACAGQTIPLAEGYSRLYILAAARGGDAQGTFMVNGQPPDQVPPGPVSHILSIQDGVQPIARWGREGDAGYVKHDPVAWVATHCHTPGGDQAYVFACLFQYAIDLPPGATSIVLPDNPDIRIFAMTLANNPNDDAWPATPLYDDMPLERVPPRRAPAEPSPPGDAHRTPPSRPAPTAAQDMDTLPPGDVDRIPSPTPTPGDVRHLADAHTPTALPSATPSLTPTTAPTRPAALAPTPRSQQGSTAAWLAGGAIAAILAGITWWIRRAAIARRHKGR